MLQCLQEVRTAQSGSRKADINLEDLRAIRKMLQEKLHQKRKEVDKLTWAAFRLMSGEEDDSSGEPRATHAQVSYAAFPLHHHQLYLDTPLEP